jgi:putative DNA primase/helicase
MNPDNDKGAASATHLESITRSRFEELALPMVARHIEVIPVEPLQKRSLLPEWNKQATTDTALIGEWSKLFPEHNVGCVANADVGVLDCDVKELPERIEAETGQKLPETFTVKSANKQAPHYYFKHTERSRQLDNRSHPHLFDFKAHDSYVVGPGSTVLCDDGNVREYTIVCDNELAEIPDWLCAWIEKNADARKNADAARKGHKVSPKFDIDAFLSHYGFTFEQKGDWYVTDVCPVAGHKHEQSTETGFYYDGQTFGFECFAGNCPGSNMSVGDVVRFLNQPRDGVVRAPYPGEIWAKDATVAELDDNADYTVSADDFLVESLPPREPLLTTTNGANLLYRKSVNEVFSYRGVGKSLFTLAGLVKPLTVGGTWLRYAGKGGNRVLLVDGELPAEQMQERIRLHVGPTGGLLRFISPERLPKHTLPALHTQAAQDWMIRQIEKARADVVIFDTLTACFRFDTNDTDAWSAVNQFFIRLRLLGLCVVVVHHAGKNGTQRGRTDGDDNMDLIIKLEAPSGWEPGDGAEFGVTYEKVRAGDRLRPFNAKLERVTSGLKVGVQWVEAIDPTEAKVCEMWLASKTQRQIAAAVGVNQSTVSRIINRLKKNPMVEQPKVMHA